MLYVSMMFLTIIWLIMGVPGKLVLAQGQEDVNRLNYGVYFKHHRMMKPVTGTWRHTFAIPIPDDKFLSRLHDDSVVSQEALVNKHYKNGTSLSCAQSVVVGIDRMSNDNFCIRYKASLRFMKNLASYGRTEIQNILMNINNLLPVYSGENGRIRQRSLLPFIGDFSKSLFGTATSGDMEALAKHIDEIAVTQNRVTETIKKTVGDMTSYMTLNNKRFDAIVENLHDIVDDNMKMTDTLSTQTLTHTSFVSNVTTQTLQLKQTIDAIIERYVSFRDAVETLVTGHLSPIFVHETWLNNTLRSIEHTVRATMLSDVIHKEVSYYYKHATFIYTRKEQLLFITMQIPLTYFMDPFHTYTIQKFPLMLNNDTDHIMMLEDDNIGFAVNDAHSYFYFPNKDEMQDLETYHDHTQWRIFNDARTSHCLLDIFLDNAEGVNVTCKYHIFMNTPASGIFHVRESTYLLLNIPFYQEKCGEIQIGNYGSSTRKTGCTACLITISPNCTYEDGKYFVPMSMNSLKPTESKTAKYVTNIPLLAQFFDKNTMNILKGGIMTDLPSEINVPKFNFYKHNISDVLAQDDKLKISLTKAANQVKTDSQIVNSLQEAVVLGKIPLTDNFFLSPPGFAMESLGGALLLLVIFAIYLSIRVRKLAVALAVLQAGMPRVAYAQFSFDYYRTENPKSPRISDNGMQESGISFTKADYIKLSILLLIVVLIVQFLFGKIIKIRNKRNFQPKCHLYFLIQSAENAVTIYIKTLNGLACDYSLSAVHYIRNVQVQGGLLPKLNIDWQTLLVENRLTGGKEGIDTKFAITWGEVTEIKKILGTRYVVQPILKGDDLVVYARVATRVDKIEDQSMGGANWGSRVDLNAPPPPPDF